MIQRWHKLLVSGLLLTVATMTPPADAQNKPVSENGFVSLFDEKTLQGWRLEHGQSPDDAVVERIVSQFYTPT